MLELLERRLRRRTANQEDRWPIRIFPGGFVREDWCVFSYVKIYTNRETETLKLGAFGDFVCRIERKFSVIHRDTPFRQ
jgi:hypothetical protein